MARFYDASMGKIEQACLSNWRSELLSGIAGNVLEIGSGTGVNIQYYPRTVERLFLTEPDPDMLAILRKNVNSLRGVEAGFTLESIERVQSTGGDRKSTRLNSSH